MEQQQETKTVTVICEAKSIILCYRDDNKIHTSLLFLIVLERNRIFNHIGLRSRLLYYRFYFFTYDVHQTMHFKAVD